MQLGIAMPRMLRSVRGFAKAMCEAYASERVAKVDISLRLKHSAVHPTVGSTVSSWRPAFQFGCRRGETRLVKTFRVWFCMQNAYRESVSRSMLNNVLQSNITSAELINGTLFGGALHSSDL